MKTIEETICRKSFLSLFMNFYFSKKSQMSKERLFKIEYWKLNFINILEDFLLEVKSKKCLFLPVKAFLGRYNGNYIHWLLKEEISNLSVLNASRTIVSSYIKTSTMEEKIKIILLQDVWKS